MLEVGLYSYLGGEWRTCGWWYYYVYACVVKAFLGTLILLALGTGVTLFSKFYRMGWRDELISLAPPLAVFVLVSSQTGMNQHLRYVIPAFPFFFIYAGKAIGLTASKGKIATWITGAIVLGTSISSLSVYPHSLGYFNEVVGGPLKGAGHLLGSNIDWGQDMLYLRRWLDKHAEAKQLRLAHYSLLDSRQFGFNAELPSPGPRPNATYSDEESKSVKLGPEPGWYAISVNRIYSRTENYRYFLRFKPVATAGYSIYDYHITLQDANRVRRGMGVP